MTQETSMWQVSIARSVFVTLPLWQRIRPDFRLRKRVNAMVFMAMGSENVKKHVKKWAIEEHIASLMCFNRKELCRNSL